jgi:predicted O-methyltransferase YrrM
MICFDYINDYIRKTIKQEDALLAGLRSFASERNIPIIQPETARLLHVTGLMIKPRRILEIGTAMGYSSILLSRTQDADGKIDTIEKDEEMIALARKNIKKAGLCGRITVIAGDALDVLTCLDKQYDLIFLDAAKGQYPQFLPECLRMLRKGGILFSDNVLYKGMVAEDELVVRRKITIVKRLREYLEALCNHDELETSLLPIGDGVTISIRK